MSKARKNEKIEEEEEEAYEESPKEDSIAEFPAIVLPKPISEKADNLSDRHKLTDKERKQLMEILNAQYLKNIVNAGEAVGMVAAQSLGEPGTQLTLRTKHYAGAAEVSVGSGIQRVEEIVDGRTRAKYPVMTIKLIEALKKDKKKAEALAKNLIDIRVDDVVTAEEDFDKKMITLTLREERMKEKGLDPKEMLGKVKENVEKGNVAKRANTLQISFAKNSKLRDIRKVLLKLMNKRISGIAGIEKTIVVEDKETREYVIKTRGTNLKAVLRMEEIDVRYTTTNDIAEIARVLGIEAARYCIANELHGTLKENNIAVDIRHIMLIADLITFTGEIAGTVRTGIIRSKESPFAKAAFEETANHLLDAAFKGEKELLLGVVENIIVGQPIRIGTGTVKLIMKE
ncbi:MAG: DNA-directed RNA polymerase subunit A'' [Candidatus Diapherotrites archaeon CG08_land_8_20_14_0_20_34_12]|nr:MAG: DNA-directed RNA polymerase subunit A'' [Candidatus Diapherotrites archaeon CG08_land_8_20_14_0_20_34_12]